ncbi:MAG: alpha/beta hydrolase [Anaerolineales bacterium]|nr:alpha/beta hydrolase [Anaerolineales bacterium]
MRILVFLLGLVLALPLALLSFLTFSVPITTSGMLTLIGCWLVTATGLCAPWQKKYALGVGIIGVVLVLGVFAARFVLTTRSDTLELVTLPGEGSGRLLTRLFDERDVVLYALPVARTLGLVTRQEFNTAPETFEQIYAEIATAEGMVPSPFLTTYLLAQSPRRFDLLVLEPDIENPDSALVFLHGFGGNFTLQCWLVGQTAQDLGILTICPATRFDGYWWGEYGKRTLETTLDYLKARGVQHVFLAGLSNGGVGASRLALDVAGEIDGLILISGADPGAEPSGIPALVIHATGDERIPVSTARRYAEQAGELGTYVEYAGDHFLLAKRADEVLPEIQAWLFAQSAP